MTLDHVIRNMQKTPEFEQKVYLGDFARNFFEIDIDYYDTNQRLTCYFLKKWNCTNTFVGLRVYFLDNELIVISNQSNKNSREIFSWVSENKYKYTKRFIESFIKEEININLIDLNTEIPMFYNLDFFSQICSTAKKNAYFNQEKVEILGKKDHLDIRGNYLGDLVEIELPNKNLIWISIKNLDFKINIKNNDNDSNRIL